MKRRPEDLTAQRFDLVVLGGGILGACVARDAALRGLSVALLEREDFASGTSSNSLKVVHGGLRHLQHLDIPGMRNSVRERATWLRIAPHLVEPLPVVVPLFGGVSEKTAFRWAVRLNDLLSSDRNVGLSEERKLQDGRALSRRDVLDWIPQLQDRGVTGGVLFFDAKMYSSERLVLSVIRAAVEARAVVLNYAKCTGPLLQDGKRAGVMVVDRMNGSEFPVRARVIVNASGPRAAGLSARLLGRAIRRSTAYSLAWNLVLPGMGHEAAFALPGESATPTGSGGRVPRRLFVVPWRGRTLLGTGHAPFLGDPESFEGMQPDHPALRAFMDEVNGAWPGTPLSVEDAQLIHVGLLPADSVDADKATGEVRLTRHHWIDEEWSGGAPVLTATTVKFTTARWVAEDAVDRACRILGHWGVSSRTAQTLLPGAPEEGVPSLLSVAHGELSSVLPNDVLEHLVRSYGTTYRDVLELRAEDPRWDQRMHPGSPVIRAQLTHGVRREMAQWPDDLLKRRTELGARGPVDQNVHEQAVKILEESTGALRRSAT